VTNAVAVFVNGQSGSNSATGTKESPFKTISAGIAGAGGHTNVFVCATGYSETVTIPSNINLYGGFDCQSWAYTGAKPVVTSASGDSALVITGGTAFIIEDMSWVSPDGTGNDSMNNGKSSIAAIVSNAAGVSFKRSSFQAGAGAPARSGDADGGTFSGPAPSGQTPTNGDGGAPGAQTRTNTSGETSGGTGGIAASSGANGGPGSSNPAIGSIFPSGNDGAGGQGTNCSTGSGHDGSYGGAGGGGLAATNIGALSGTKWIPASGGAGGMGSVAEGGGGGASTDVSGAGGGGGAGGCGGSGGGGGAGGGASLAVAMNSAGASFIQCTFIAGVGGGGGSGSKGQTGQGGGSHGSGVGNACPGGKGGFGGSGGGGAGGSGGVSAGLLWSGGAPSVDGTRIVNGAKLTNVTLPTSAGGGGGGGPGGDAPTSGAASGSAGAMGSNGQVAAAIGL
jgi:hypothetical protein